VASSNQPGEPREWERIVVIGNLAAVLARPHEHTPDRRGFHSTPVRRSRENATMASAPIRKIVHIDMDAFYASVEQRDDPSLRGRPVVVAWRGARSVVCAASYEARKFGVRSAMPALRAERLCPGAVFLPPDFPRYKQVSRQTREIFARHTDLIEPLSLDEAYLDVSRNKCGLPSATAVAQRIREQIRDELRLTASAGVAPNKFLAKLASDWNKPDGLCVIRPEQAQALIGPLPLGRLPGVGRVMEAKLLQLGLRTVADLRDYGAMALEQRFGRWGQRLHELSLGIDEHPVETERPTRQVSCEDTFARDLRLHETGPAIERLSADCWRQFERLGLPIARTVVLKLKTADFRILTRSLTPERPPEDAPALAVLALGLRERVALPSRTRYRLVGVGLANFAATAATPLQAGLFGEA
jgi:DNA polymerase-4